MTAEAKMVVVWGGDDVLSTSIKSLLAANEDWKVVPIVNKEDLDALLLKEDSSNLVIVMICLAHQKSQEEIPLQLLQDRPAIKVIHLSLENNLMDVYSKQKLMISRPLDLITVI